MNFKEAIEKREHLIALGQTDIHLYGDDANDAPWHLASRIESGGSYRLSGPTGFRVVAECSGLRFSWTVEFEGRDANGSYVSQFDRAVIRDAAMKLPETARKSFSEFMQTQVLPGVQKRTAEMREALNTQLDSEDCVRGVIAFVNESLAVAN